MEQNDVSAEPAYPLDVTGWVDRRTEHAGLRGLQSRELRYTLADERSCQSSTETWRTPSHSAVSPEIHSSPCS
jgi:hypothetical protein